MVLVGSGPPLNATLAAFSAAALAADGLPGASERLAYSVTVKVAQLGTYILAVYRNGRQLGNSPFRLSFGRHCLNYVDLAILWFCMYSA
jgi:hypothetical protein